MRAEIGAVHLKALKEVRADRIGITGFCMGGRVTFLSACQHAADIKAAVAFYGGGIGVDAPNAMSPLDQVKKVEDTLKRPGKTFEVKVYKAAGHGFFCNERASYLLPPRLRQGRLGKDPLLVS